MSTNTYDAIVIGSGISGGWAAKELTEKGLKTIMLERGRNIEHIKDYVNANKAPWEYEHLIIGQAIKIALIQKLNVLIGLEDTM
jgi:choline dehydrogenase-like flavoprotein